MAYFGGEEGLLKRKSLDDKKRKLCQENNVKLIEWKYTELISNQHFIKNFSYSFKGLKIFF
nr:MAG TPA_asm: hypothetical protein [Bacteriophage sp.]